MLALNIKVIISGTINPFCTESSKKYPDILWNDQQIVFDNKRRERRNGVRCKNII